MSGIRFLERDKNKNIKPENIETGTIQADSIIVTNMTIDTITSTTISTNDIQSTTGTITSLESNSISAATGTTITIDGDIDMNSHDITDIDNIKGVSLFMSNSAHTQNTSYKLHITSLQSAGIWIESDTNNVNESDLPIVLLSQDGNRVFHSIGGGAANHCVFQNMTTDTTKGFMFVTGDVIASAQGTVPAFTSPNTLMFLKPTVLEINVPTDFGANDITDVGTLTTTSLEVTDNVNIPGGVVQQVGTILDDVTLNTHSGIITTVNSTLAPGTFTTFDLINDKITADSAVLVSVTGYTGAYYTDGLVNVTTGAAGVGQIPILVFNPHATNAHNGAISISFLVITS